MVSNRSHSVAERAKLLYEQDLRDKLESHYLSKFVAIEPDSKDYFVADSYAAAVALARGAHPDRIAFVLRIGQDAALHLGGVSR